MATPNIIPDAGPDEDSWQPTVVSDYREDDMVTLFVGEQERKMLVHGSYLSRHSEFFRAALKKEWVEGQTRTIKPPEETPELMAQYLNFLYGKRLPTDSTKNDTQKGAVYNALTALYALGERLLDCKIRNAILREIVRFTTLISEGLNCFPASPAINNIYNCTTEASPARRLMVDLYVTNGGEDWFASGLHSVFFQDLAKALSVGVKHSSSLPLRAREVVAEEYVVML